MIQWSLFTGVALGLVTNVAMAAEPPTLAISFDVLRQRAAEMSQKEYVAGTEPALPKELQALDYSQYQQLQFRPEASPWHTNRLGFDLRFISRGFIFHDPVKMHVVKDGRQQDVTFTPSMFSFGNLKLTNPLPAGLDFAGFKIVHRTDPHQRWDEIASFVGASYYRVVGEGLRYGASARALALDTGEPAGEEFPRFTEFWIETPQESSDRLQVLALLDSPSVAGACRFLLTVGKLTSSEAEVSFYPRNGAKKYGIAPLTSMFLMGENHTRCIPDFRPEVHDSDGLRMIVDGQELWRPLENPVKRHRISSFPVKALTGFGLMQRDRSFADYQDLEARYDLRPSLWVEPLGQWGEGRIELVEIPTPVEFNDNIVAYWVPSQKPEPGKELRFRYRLTALGDEPPGSLLRVTATRIGPATDKKAEKFVIDFAGTNRDATATEATIRPHCTVTGGTAKNAQAMYNEVTGGWRVVFDFEPGEGEKEIRVYLESSGKPVSETWIERPLTE